MKTLPVFLLSVLLLAAPKLATARLRQKQTQAATPIKDKDLDQSKRDVHDEDNQFWKRILDEEVLSVPTLDAAPVVPCTLELKVCPDGTQVGRTGPNCDFEPCPADTPLTPAPTLAPVPVSAPVPVEAVPCTLELLICPDGTQVGRTGPDCDFEPCPTSPEEEPTSTPDTVSPTTASTVSGYTTQIVEGDSRLGDCYFVEASAEFTSPNPISGCIFTTLYYVYYNDNDDGDQEEVYDMVQVDVTHDCTDGQPNTCSISGCNGCLYEPDDQGVTLLGCDDPEQSIFATDGNQMVGFFYDGNDHLSYELKFFRLKDDPGRCDRFGDTDTDLDIDIDIDDGPDVDGDPLTPIPGVFCTQDVLECPDGEFVGRDPESDCEFFPCPYVGNDTDTSLGFNNNNNQTLGNLTQFS